MTIARIGLLGCGNIGSGLLRLLKDMEDELQRRYDLSIQVKRILVRDLTKAREDCGDALITDKAEDILLDPDIGLVVEVMGGEEPAASLMARALNLGKTVVTANKMALALHWHKLHQAAREGGAGLYYEASVCGAIPVIRTVNESLQANQVDTLMGIVNGTTNYILSRMTDEQRPYEEVLQDAQALGLAEPDPASDVDGYDAAYKLSVLSSLAFHRHVPYSAIHREGIREVALQDIEAGKALGLRLKLLAIAKRGPDHIEARVHPAFVPESHPLAAVSGAFNAIFLHGHASGDMMLYGKGAGPAPTAGAILSDIVFALLRPDALQASPATNGQAKDQLQITSNWRCAYYLRFMAQDVPGVLGHIATRLGEHGVSIESLVQRGTPESGRVPVIVITHQAEEKALQAALAAVDPQRAQAISAIRLEGLDKL